jgi:hypothetical protein
MPGVTMSASTTGGGQAMTTGPTDVCKVPAAPAPPVPTPFPNIGQVAQASGTSTKVKFCRRPVVTKSSKISRSMGDEAGTLGGMVSNVNMNQIVWKKASSKVKAQKKKIVYHTAMTGHNGSNANMPAGLQSAPSQTKVKVAM